MYARQPAMRLIARMYTEEKPILPTGRFGVIEENRCVAACTYSDIERREFVGPNGERELSEKYYDMPDEVEKSYKKWKNSQKLSIDTMIKTVKWFAKECTKKDECVCRKCTHYVLTHEGVLMPASKIDRIHLQKWNDLFAPRDNLYYFQERFGGAFDIYREQKMYIDNNGRRMIRSIFTIRFK